MSRVHIGRLLDELDVKLDVSNNQHLTHVLVVGKVMDLDTGASYLVLGSNELDWIDEGALLHAAMETRRASMTGMLLESSQCNDPNCEEHNGEG